MKGFTLQVISDFFLWQNKYFLHNHRILPCDSHKGVVRAPPSTFIYHREHHRICWAIIPGNYKLATQLIPAEGWVSFRDHNVCMYACSVVSNSLIPHALEPTRLLCPWDSPGKNTPVGWHLFPQGNRPDPGIEPISLVPPELAGRFFTAEPLWKLRACNNLDQ